ncbi:hypothetical protein [Alicyclobacillus acidocaldarius]|uniref:Uncharacterized protein n=1 Tax=Alicyclobacillus acidocaldarius (strain Tc-4-1) TaxID=1048834 RepID=F8ICZ8_ALIAT|nr:hypothetical protein [Alicyclobacillus acidocaldarius]AEJ45003.1 hypothetical protein TC41_3119 [Alicyclobacillus acidocaldarius subsp. acidocaldarius Tc-4-1]
MVFVSTSRWMGLILAVTAATAGSGSLVWASTAFANTVPHPHHASAQATVSASPSSNQPSFVFLPPWPDEWE